MIEHSSFSTSLSTFVGFCLQWPWNVWNYKAEPHCDSDYHSLMFDDIEHFVFVCILANCIIWENIDWLFCPLLNWSCLFFSKNFFNTGRIDTMEFFFSLLRALRIFMGANILSDTQSVNIFSFPHVILNFLVVSP